MSSLELRHFFYWSRRRVWQLQHVDPPSICSIPLIPCHNLWNGHLWLWNPIWNCGFILPIHGNPIHGYPTGLDGFQLPFWAVSWNQAVPLWECDCVTRRGEQLLLPIKIGGVLTRLIGLWSPLWWCDSHARLFRWTAGYHGLLGDKQLKAAPMNSPPRSVPRIFIFPSRCILTHAL